jgi:hypothetical protein
MDASNFQSRKNVQIRQNGLHTDSSFAIDTPIEGYEGN